MNLLAPTPDLILVSRLVVNQREKVLASMELTFLAEETKMNKQIRIPVDVICRGKCCGKQYQISNRMSGFMYEYNIVEDLLVFILNSLFLWLFIPVFSLGVSWKGRRNRASPRQGPDWWFLNCSPRPFRKRCSVPSEDKHGAFGDSWVGQGNYVRNKWIQITY